jgi:hypothetical protein
MRTTAKVHRSSYNRQSGLYHTDSVTQNDLHGEEDDALVRHRDLPNLERVAASRESALVTEWCGVQKGRTAISDWPG